MPYEKEFGFGVMINLNKYSDAFNKKLQFNFNYQNCNFGRTLSKFFGKVFFSKTKKVCLKTSHHFFIALHTRKYPINTIFLQFFI